MFKPMLIMQFVNFILQGREVEKIAGIQRCSCSPNLLLFT